MRTLIKHIVLLFVIAMSAGWTYAQQVNRYSMYTQNFYAMNPAAAGLEDHIDVTLAYRKQWLGVKHAPETYFASANMPLTRHTKSPAHSSMHISNPDAYNDLMPAERRSKHGLGAMVSANRYGAFRFTQWYATYAFHLPVTKKLNLSFGSSVGVNAFSIDESLITLEIPDDAYYDEVIREAQQNTTLFDVDVGILLYSKRLFVGYSTEQLLGNRVGFGGKSQFGDLIVHHRILFGRNFRLNRDWRIIPSGFVNLTQNGLLSVEANVRADFRDQLWGGLSYRHKDAVVPMFGVYLNDQIKIGYAYDIDISVIRQYVPAGSHEIMLGFMFGNKRVVF